jgi:hypothetical protein
MQHAAEFRRCLLEMDVNGIMRLWAHVSPHLPQPSGAEALIQLHIARCEARYFPKKAKDYSLSWLAEQGYQKIDGQWVSGVPSPKAVAEAVGISSRSASGYVLPINKKIMRYMEDALLNTMAKGVTEPLVQKDAMLKARDKVRFKARMA